METDLLNFSGKNIWVTGAASGIGRATALRFLAHGASVTGSDVSESGLAETKKLAGADASRLKTILCDVTSSKSVQELAQKFEKSGPLHAIVNCAGIAKRYTTPAMTDEEWDSTLSVNLDGTMRCCRAALPLLEKTKGAIVNIASIEGLFGENKLAAYCASKHGVVGLTKALAREISPKGIRVNAICPGAIDTPMMWSGGTEMAPPLKEAIVKKTPLRRVGQPDDIARVALFLASDLAGFVTGTTLAADGGLTSGF